MGVSKRHTRNLDILATFALITSLAAFTLLWTTINRANPKNQRRQVHLTVTVSEVKTLPQPAPQVQKHQITGEKTCFIDEKTRKSRCTRYQATGIPLSGGEKTLPLLLGVGPAKTSSTALFDSLGNHPEIILGNVSRVGHTCCGSELYYFSRRFNSSNPAGGLGAYFPLESKPEARWAAEKTPEYSDHFLAPYRVRATLQPSALALVFTIRDPVDAHVSLYFYRMQRKKLKSSARGFLEWSKSLLKAHHLYRKCVQAQLLAHKHKEPISTNMSPNWIGVQSLDEAVFEACRAPYFKPSDRLEGVGSLEYSHTLPRWKRVFDTTSSTNTSELIKNDNKNKKSNKSGTDPTALKNQVIPMMCVFHQDYITNPGKEAKRVAQLIGLDPGKLRIPPSDDGGATTSTHSSSSFERLAEERVFASEGANENATIALELRHHMKKLRGFFSGEMEFAQEFCRDLAENSHPLLPLQQ